MLTETILRRVFDRIHSTGVVTRLPTTYRTAGSGPMSRVAAAAILRLAVRWPALTVLVILWVVAARAMSGRPHKANGTPRVLRDP